jgi:hypothetical protein
MLHQTIALFALVLLPALCCADIVSKKSDRSSPYKYEYYYDGDTTSSCETVIMINVGTFMSTDAYSKLANAIVIAGSQQNASSSGTIAIIVDSNPNRIMKDDGKKYADVVNAIAGSISTIIPKCTAPPLYFIGGHSGGGKGAINALNLNVLNFSVAGFVGLDPFEVSKEDRSNLRIDVPSLQWGFNETSCLVVKENAAEAAYNISNTNRRIFYRVNTKKPKTIITGPHCSFANHGCFGACQSAKGLPWIRTQVGITFNHFVMAIKSNNFDRDQFSINETGAVLLVNMDEVPQ